MASNYFNTDQVLEMVLADDSHLEDEEIVEEGFGDLGRVVRKTISANPGLVTMTTHMLWLQLTQD